MSQSAITGLHHITAIAGDAQRNLDFYSGVLGLRLVKYTVNYDDPFTAHLYYGDAIGTPGTLITFFVWGGGSRGRQGRGGIAVVSLVIPPASYGYWLERLIRFGVPFQRSTRRGAAGRTESVLAFSDPDGLLLELVATESAGRVNPWGERIAPELSIRGLHAAQIWVDGTSASAAMLTDDLGFVKVGDSAVGEAFAPSLAPHQPCVVLRDVGGFTEAAEGTGTVHHLAFATSDTEHSLALQRALVDRGRQVSEQKDRGYFTSIYFREPAGILYEVATDGPGFTLDETPAELGSSLRLPAALEPQRSHISAFLPELQRDRDRVPFRED